MQKKRQHQRTLKWRSTKGKSIRSGMEDQNRYIWIQDITDKEKPATKRSILFELSSVYDPFGLGSAFTLEGRKIIQKL